MAAKRADALLELGDLDGPEGLEGCAEGGRGIGEGGAEGRREGELI
jgi:hypothetical protein